jgi:hypothetical protein
MLKQLGLWRTLLAAPSLLRALRDGQPRLTAHTRTSLEARWATPTRGSGGRCQYAPKLIGVYRAAVAAIDHNLYTKGDRVYEANYRSGLRVLDSTRVAEGELEEVAFFDVYPEDDEAEFNGAWSVYPYFESGIVIVSGIEQGLFVLRPD